MGLATENGRRKHLRRPLNEDACVREALRQVIAASAPWWMPPPYAYHER